MHMYINIELPILFDRFFDSYFSELPQKVMLLNIFPLILAIAEQQRAKIDGEWV